MTINYSAVIGHLVDQKHFSGWFDEEREIGWLGPATDYNNLDWRESNYDVPTEFELAAIWNAHPEIFEVVDLWVEHQSNNTYRITVRKRYNIDGETSLTLTASGVEIPGAIIPIDNIGTKDIDVEVTVDIGVSENYPHETVRIEV